MVSAETEVAMTMLEMRSNNHWQIYHTVHLAMKDTEKLPNNQGYVENGTMNLGRRQQWFTLPRNNSCH